MKTAIRIDNLKEGSRGAICFADIVIQIERDGQPPVEIITIHECSIRDSEKGHWLALPVRPWAGQDGKTRYKKTITLSDHTTRATLAAMEAEWSAFQSAPAIAEEHEGIDPFQDQ